MSVSIALTVFYEGIVVISTLDENVLGSPMPGADESEYPLMPCNHEEFDTRVVLHAANAVSHGYKHILIIANDNDIIVLGISVFGGIGADKVWVKFGIGNKLRNISIHDICSTMSSDKAKALPAFHALAGSDNTSFFSGTVKKSAYAKWGTRPELTATLCHMMDKPETLSSDEYRCHRELCHLIVFGFLYSGGCQPSAPADIRLIISPCRVSSADESSLGRAR